MSVFKQYEADELVVLADRRSDEVRVATAGDRTGVALPDWESIQPCAMLSTERARKLAAQLLVACDEHDAIQESAFQIPSPVEDRVPVTTRQGGKGMALLRGALDESEALWLEGGHSRGSNVAYSVLRNGVRWFLDGPS